MKNLNRNLIALLLFMSGYLAITNPKVLIETLSSMAYTMLPLISVLTLLVGLHVTYKIIKK